MLDYHHDFDIAARIRGVGIFRKDLDRCLDMIINVHDDMAVVAAGLDSDSSFDRRFQMQRSCDRYGISI